MFVHGILNKTDLLYSMKCSKASAFSLLRLFWTFHSRFLYDCSPYVSCPVLERIFSCRIVRDSRTVVAFCKAVLFLNRLVVAMTSSYDNNVVFKSFIDVCCGEKERKGDHRGLA